MKKWQLAAQDVDTKIGAQVIRVWSPSSSKLVLGEEVSF